MTTEKDRRIYYQNIVYAVCGCLDEINDNHFNRGTGIVCGNVNEPTREVQDQMHILESRITKVRELKSYLMSDKFYKDTTVQVADVLRRLEL